MTAVEIVTIRPKHGALPRLLEIRPVLVSEYQARFPTVTAQLFAQEDGTLVDIWTWPDRETAEGALADPTVSRTFTEEWQPLVDLISFAWAEPLAS